MLGDIYFYAVDPGSVSVMRSVVNECPSGIKYIWVADGYAKKLFNSIEIEYSQVENAIESVKAGDVFLLGSQMKTEITAGLIKKLSKKKVNTIFIFDHWSNCLKHFKSKDESILLPDRIFVIDKYIKTDLVKTGVNHNIIDIVGHPGIEHELNKVEEMNDMEKKSIMDKEGLKPANKIMLLALEPISNDYQTIDIKYDEYSIMLLVYKAIRSLKYDNIQLIVRLHPRQSRKDFNRFLRENKLHDDIVLCTKNITLAESLKIADVIIGITSVYLVKALASGKPTVSLQLNPKINNFIVPYLEEVKINDPLEIKVALSDALLGNNNYKISLPTESAGKVWNRIMAFSQNNDQEVAKECSEQVRQGA